MIQQIIKICFHSTHHDDFITVATAVVILSKSSLDKGLYWICMLQLKPITAVLIYKNKQRGPQNISLFPKTIHNGAVSYLGI